jgi:Flp pilus assembly pilin Flp
VLGIEDEGLDRPSKCRRSEAGSLGRKAAMKMMKIWNDLWKQEDGQDIAEYAVMLAVILVIVIGTIRLIGTNANTIFSRTASNLQ